MQAIKLNVCGFVRNIDSGHVEIFAQGDPVALEQLVTWCHHGPSLAKVTEVAVSEYDSNEVFSDFQIR
jgi:acylphosphatase